MIRFGIYSLRRWYIKDPGDDSESQVGNDMQVVNGGCPYLFLMSQRSEMSFTFGRELGGIPAINICNDPVVIGPFFSSL